MTRLEITDIFFIPMKGIAVVGDISGTFKGDFTIGERVKIIRPDRTYIHSTIHGIEKFSTVSGNKKVGVLLDTLIVKEDVPLGSVMEIIDFE